MSGIQKDARLNFDKHGVHFSDALSVLEDSSALSITEESADGEERSITIVTDLLGRILLVVNTWRDARRTPSLCRGIMKREYDFSNAKRGPVVKPPPGKTRVTIRLDKSGGGNCQKLINDALREYLARQREPLETTIRRVIGEELQRAG